MAGIEQKIAVLSQALNLRTQRHQVLASNIANADTPNYKARDFSFEGAMRTAMAGNSAAGSVGLARTASGHLGGDNSGGPAALMYRGSVQSAVDGNTVDMDVERSNIAENALQYQILTQLIGDRFKAMRSAMASTSS